MTAQLHHSPQPVLDVRGLNVFYPARGGFDAARHHVVQDVSFSIPRFGMTALLGESGSGKSTIGKSIIGLLPRGAVLEKGSIDFDGLDMTSLAERQMEALRGRRIGFIPQDPSNSLNPVKTVGAQLGEMFTLHGRYPRETVRARSIALLERVGLKEPARRFSQYPHELSGGMRQRVLIAMAVALKPELIIADEPTSALDATVQMQILDLLDTLCQENGTSVLLVTHDLSVAAARTNHTIILRGGRVEEEGATRDIFANPASAYTRTLLDSRPRFVPATGRPVFTGDQPDAAVTVENLVQEYPLARGRTFRAVDDISFSVRAGTTHALVGESGSGKTTILRALVGLLKPTAGSIHVAGQDVSTTRGTLAFRRQIQLVYQNPHGSLNPKQTVGEILEEAIGNFQRVDRADRQKAVRHILDRVGLPRSVIERRPGMMSGGQCQRVALARGLVIQPRVLVLDEVVSALDVCVQAQILTLLTDLQKELGLTYIFVSHDLAVVRQISDTVTVLYHGRQMESGTVESVFTTPRSDYTKLLIAAAQ
ncbi:dipeptide ABC transporter ATP-binding protein [Gluconacetobacter asukensis]|uniref:ABC transporter ATP-binding protein n=1 Tax=Gluconacetobacter asukensis TaxID=1017181 RepID=A0A7W4IZR7_9PROT|nr:ABC transporter ATP-binding protein [Gluconacetobacter asukensis]MBB2171797.1 ABC transporter ATP-binding protein [Gluconacetobacter asukensis]